MSAGALFEVRGLTKRHGHVRALRGVDFDLAAGELVAVFGPNGAGKSTLLRILAGLVRPTAGEIAFAGRPLLKSLAELRRRLGYVSHQSMLYDSLSARENLAFAGRLHGLREVGSRVAELLEAMELTERAGDPVGTLSRGLQQRVSVARALLHDPDVIFMDEPFTGLDQHAARVLRDLLEGVRRRGRTVLLVTHDLARGLELASRVVVLRAGRIVLDRRAESLEAATFEDVYLRCIRGEATAPVGRAS